MSVRASDISFSRDPLDVKDHFFRKVGEDRYQLELLPAGILFDVDRLRRERHELVGELSVTLSGNFLGARTVDNVLSVGDFNFSSVNMRQTRSKLLQERSRVESLDWFGFLEEFCVKTINAERMGAPAVTLADLELPPEEKVELWEVDDWPVLATLPMVLFGDAGSGKSYWALWIAGNLALRGVNVLYLDWEFDAIEHRKRLGELFNPVPRGVKYARCDSPMTYQTDRLKKILREFECSYVVADSVGFALDGPPESAEGATKYFRALRQLGVGSLNLAHIPKQYDDSREAQIFGSVFFKAGARSAWFCEAAKENPPNELRFALHHRKNNVGRLLAARGFKMTFGQGRTRIDAVDVKAIDELAAQLPLLDRVKRLLARTGALTVKALSEEMGTTAGAIRSLTSRHTSTFIRVGQKIGLKEEATSLEF